MTKSASSRVSKRASSQFVPTRTHPPNNEYSNTANSSLNTSVRRTIRAAKEYTDFLDELSTRYPNPRNIPYVNRQRLTSLMEKFINSQMNVVRRSG